MDVIVKAVEAESPEKIVKSYIWDAMNEEEKELGEIQKREKDVLGITRLYTFLLCSWLVNILMRQSRLSSLD